MKTVKNVHINPYARLTKVIMENFEFLWTKMNNMEN